MNDLNTRRYNIDIYEMFWNVAHENAESHSIRRDSERESEKWSIISNEDILPIKMFWL